MNEGTNEPRSIEERQDDIVADFLSIDDPLSQYEYLLEFAAALPALDEAQKTDENLVEGCQSQVWLVLEDRGGRLGCRPTPTPSSSAACCSCSCRWWTASLWRTWHRRPSTFPQGPTSWPPSTTRAAKVSGPS